MGIFSRPKGIRIGRFTDLDLPAIRIADTAFPTLSSRGGVEKALEGILSGNHRMAILEGERFLGFVTDIDVLDYLGGGEKRRIFTQKGRSLNVPVSRIMDSQVLHLDRDHTIGDALGVFKKEGVDSHPITGKEGLLGVLSDSDFTKVIRGRTRTTLGEVMDRKPMALKENYSILDTSRIMARCGIRVMPVVKDNIFLGMITPTNILEYLNKNKALRNLRDQKNLVSSVMDKEVLTLGPGSDVIEAIEVMRKGDTQGIAVLEDQELLGMVTYRDILDWVV